MSFRSAANNKHRWITILGDNTPYPDELPVAIRAIRPVIITFKALAKQSSSSSDLLKRINKITGNERVQLLRAFRWMVCKSTPVELLKKKGKEAEIITNYSPLFKEIGPLRATLETIPDDDGPLAYAFWQHGSRGSTGYELTGEFFEWVEDNLPEFSIHGPKGAGKDPPLKSFIPESQSDTPVDFAIKFKGKLVALGWARYDSDRGGSQGDDRVGVNIDHANETLKFGVKCIFVNEGIGLVIGEMWEEYSKLDEISEDVRVMTLRMLPDRLTREWLLS